MTSIQSSKLSCGTESTVSNFGCKNLNLLRIRIFSTNPQARKVSSKWGKIFLSLSNFRLEKLGRTDIIEGTGIINFPRSLRRVKEVSKKSWKAGPRHFPGLNPRNAPGIQRIFGARGFRMKWTCSLALLMFRVYADNRSLEKHRKMHRLRKLLPRPSLMASNARSK